MTSYLIKRDEETIGFLTDRALAEHLDGLDLVVDGMYDHEQYTIEDVPNEDVF